MKVNGKQMAQQLPITLHTAAKITSGPGIITHDDGMGGTMISATTLVSSVDVGPGLVKTDNGYGNVTIDVANPIQPSITRIESKPIFMIGLPSNASLDVLEHVSDSLSVQLNDYHVIVLLNVTDTYTAKLFSEKDGDTLPISDIKKYIDQKLR